MIEVRPVPPLEIGRVPLIVERVEVAALYRRPLFTARPPVPR